QAEVPCRVEVLPESATSSEVTGLLARLSADPAVQGILLQEPVPEPLVAEELVLAIDPAKDIDGVHPLNAGRLFQGRDEGLVPATALGGMELLRRAGIELRGREALVIGRSTIVGRPFALLLLHAHATVTIAHSRTVDLAAQARRADLLAVAVGRAGFVTADMVKPGAVVVDFGINYVDGALCGDVEPAVAEVAGALTPVPGGTGSMTTAALLANLIAAAEATR
ncbi:MAG: bifunctional 5,10-methylenetetrahydrofolate dehydrogenase/5,10-methenyltetrahydrofolate cyclohydrolase, partial [Armatimonadetes bacterium]|nr:bifunctional 5,10-methylenetetrahydrofolate dehydrogenase/5,10-methenyltetrahydrofolate cyclohydrolase [Armatimonadota bacterium]